VHVSAGAEQRLADELAACAEPYRRPALQAGWCFGCVEHLVLECGQWFDPDPGAASSDMATYSAAAVHSHQAGLVYVEGFLLAPTEQVWAAAWCVHPGGRLASAKPGLAYLGVPLFEGFRQQVTRRAGSAAVLHGQQLDEWRLLRAGLPTWAVPLVGRPNQRLSPHGVVLLAVVEPQTPTAEAEPEAALIVSVAVPGAPGGVSGTPAPVPSERCARRPLGHGS
jgi:hypothetical protein